MAKIETLTAEEVVEATAVEIVPQAPVAVQTQTVQPMPASITPMGMIDRALASNASIEMLERLMTLQERHEANEARKAFDLSFAAAKPKFKPIIKNKAVSHGTGKAQYKHETLDAIAEAVGDALSANGLSYRFRTVQSPGVLSVTCVLSHVAGHSEETSLSAGNDTSGSKNAIQGVGSTLYYLMRYTLKAALGLAVSDEADDDGRGAGQQQPAAPSELTAKQVEELTTLLQETGSNLALFLKAAGGAVSIASIHPALFEKLRARLLEKKAQKQAAQA